MSIFSKNDPEPVVTGADVLREATKSRRRAGNFGGLARDLHVSISDLEAFADGGEPLAEPVMQSLAREFFNARLNDAGLLEPLNKPEVKPMCASGYPPFIDPKSHPFYTPPREPGAYYAAPQPVKPVPAKPKGPRPGWADGWI